MKDALEFLVGFAMFIGAIAVIAVVVTGLAWLIDRI